MTRLVLQKSSPSKAPPKLHFPPPQRNQNRPRMQRDEVRITHTLAPPRYYCWHRLCATKMEAGIHFVDLVAPCFRPKARFLGPRPSTSFDLLGVTKLDGAFDDNIFSCSVRSCSALAPIVLGCVQKIRSSGPRLRPPSLNLCSET